MVNVGMTGSARSSLRNCLAAITTRGIAASIVMLLAAFVVPMQLILAEEPELLSSIAPQSGSSDDTFTFTVTVKNGVAARAPMLSGGNDFALRLIGPQSSVRIVNGRMTSSVMYVYQLRPKKEGTLETPSAELEIDGKKLAALPIKVKVSKGEALDDLTKNDEISDKVFLRQVASPVSLYQGQQFVLSLTLYTRVPLSEIELEDLAYDDFWSESMGPEQRTSKLIQGYTYTAVQLRKALFPLKTGRLELPSRTMTAELQEESGLWPFGGADPFADDFFGGMLGTSPSKPLTLRSDKLKIEVKPLPPVPAGTSADAVIVGKTAVKVRYSPDPVPVGGSKTVEVEVTSEGNLNPLKKLPLEDGGSVKVYDERPETQHDTRGSLLVTKKTFRYSVVPLRGGLIKLPEFSLPYFNPETGQYDSATSSPIAFPAEGPLGTPGAGVTDSGTPPLHAPIPTLAPVDLPTGPPIRYVEPGFIEKLAERVPLSVSLLILAAVLGLAAVGAAVLKLRKTPITRKDDFTAVRSAKDVRELSDAFRQFLSKRIDIESTQVTTDEIRQSLMTRGFPVEFTFEVGAILDEFDLALYGGGSPDDATFARLQARVDEVMGKVK